MMSLRTKTGIEAIDAALDGGIRSGSFVLISGPSLSGRELLAQQFFFAGISSEEAGTYITTKEFMVDVIAQMAEKGMDLSKYETKYIFVDSYAPQSDPSLQDTPTVKYVSSVADFAKLSNCIITSLGDFMSKGIYQQRLVFDSVDTVLMYVSPAGVYRFLSYLRAKIKGFKAISFLLIQPDLHEEKDVKTIMQLSDVLIEMDPVSGQLTITQAAGPKITLYYKMGEKGIEVWNSE
jgi:KaiC/GvpD/RAD55 family RecA-like ATPase